MLQKRHLFLLVYAFLVLLFQVREKEKNKINTFCNTGSLSFFFTANHET